MSGFLVYGAYGYSGRQVVEAALKRKLRPIVAGRDPARAAELGREFAVEHRSFSLDDPSALKRGLDGIGVVLHCAGPYSATMRPMLDACIGRGAHYLDLTGEFRVIEAVAARDVELRAGGTMAMCGVGMDVVPTDCLAAHVKSRLPSAERLDIYVRALEQLSPGTATTMVEGMALPNIVRAGGVLVERPPGADRRKVEFPGGRVSMVGLPWGDIATAWRTTGIPNIAVHMSLMKGAPLMIRLTAPLRGFLQSPSVQRRLKSAVNRFISGPDPKYQAAHPCEFIAEAADAAGNSVKSYLTTLEGYAFTAESASEIAKRVLEGAAVPGFQTPGGLLGADFVLDIEGSARRDLV
jgi:short subunit dehydrogenase-like uncharacterized protein